MRVVEAGAVIDCARRDAAGLVAQALALCQALGPGAALIEDVSDPC